MNKQTNKTILIFLVVLFSLVVTLPRLTSVSFAQEETANDSPLTIGLADEEETTSTPSAEEINNNLKERLKERSQDEIEAEVEAKIKEKLLQGYVGKITSIKESVVTIEDDHESIQVTLEDDTKIVKNGKEIEVSTLAIEDKIIVMGYQKEENVLTARRIVATKDSEIDSTRTAFFGQVIQVTLKTKLFTLSTPQGEKEILNPKKSTLDLEDLEINQALFVIVETDLEDDTHSLLQFKIL